jgi:amino acid transporter
MRKLVALPVLSADALSSVAYGPQAMVEWRNARITLSWMIGLLIGMFAGVLVITRLAGIVPVASQTMLSQLAHLSFGDGPVYIFIQAATAAVLLLAANTSYNDFPRVLFLMARDRQAPRSFLRIGDRLTFRNGILLLSVTSAAIYIVFRGNTESLLPLYAVGVFLAFTLSQTGMIMHWRRHRDQPHWRRSLVSNATGAVLSGIVFVIEAVTKFTAGARQEDGKPHVVKRMDRPHVRVIPEWFGGGTLPRKELHEAAEQLTANQAGLIAVGEPTIEKGLDKALTKAPKS